MVQRRRPVFNRSASQRAKEEGMARAAESQRELRDDWLDVIHDVCLQRSNFTMDDVIRLGEAREVTLPDEPRAFGPWMRSAETNGWCQQTGLTILTERVSRHRSPIKVWVSRLRPADGAIQICADCGGRGYTRKPVRVLRRIRRSDTGN